MQVIHFSYNDCGQDLSDIKRYYCNITCNRTSDLALITSTSYLKSFLGVNNDFKLVQF